MENLFSSLFSGLIIALIVCIIVVNVDILLIKKKKANVLRKEILEFLMDYNNYKVIGFNNCMIVQSCSMTETEFENVVNKLIGFSVAARLLDRTFNWSWEQNTLTYSFSI